MDGYERQAFAQSSTILNRFDVGPIRYKGLHSSPIAMKLPVNPPSSQAPARPRTDGGSGALKWKRAGRSAGARSRSARPMPETSPCNLAALSADLVRARRDCEPALRHDRFHSCRRPERARTSRPRALRTACTARVAHTLYPSDDSRSPLRPPRDLSQSVVAPVAEAAAGEAR